MLKLLSGWKAYVIGGGVILAIGFASGWTVSGWKHSASELGKLEAAISDATAKVTEIGNIATANAQAEAKLHQQYLSDSRRLADYVEASGACRITDDDIGVWYSSASPDQN